MKKLTLIIFALLFLCLIFYKFKPEKEYKVLRIVTANEVYIDFNGNNLADDNELVKIYGIRPFEPKFGRETTFRANSIGTQRPKIAALGAKTQEYAKNLLRDKFVTVEFIDDERNNKNLFSTAIIYTDKKDYGKTMLENGFALADFRNTTGYKNNENITAIDRNLENIKTGDLVLLNLKNRKYHRLECKFAQKSRDYVILTSDKISAENKKCGYCFAEATYKKYAHHIYEKIQIKNFDFTLGDISYYFLDFNKAKKPSNACKTAACKALIENINSAKTSIDFAVYGFSNQNEIVNALVSAQKRGVSVRWVTDSDCNGSNIYSDVEKVKKLLLNWSDDRQSISGKNINSIMHNKFFIFDKKIVWLGSANISDTDLSDFNANIVLLVKSPAVARVYSDEFEQMYRGKFHKEKTSCAPREQITLSSDTKVKIRFSPCDSIVANEIIPLINNAKKYVYVSVFVMTHKDLKSALIAARERGVDVRVITDATNAGDKYNITKVLRQNGVRVKVENKAGKMHSKSMVIDDKYTLVGSMNFSRSGEGFNDENFMIIENPFVAKRFREQFLYLYQSIPDKWLYKNPRAESFQSIGSCEDGVDNDFDGLIDSEDDGCKIFLKAR